MKGNWHNIERWLSHFTFTFHFSLRSCRQLSSFLSTHAIIVPDQKRHGKEHHPQGHTHQQFEGYRRSHPPGKDHGHRRRQRRRQVFAGLSHPVRRRLYPLHRIHLPVHPPVPGPDRKTGCRLDRQPAAGDRLPPEKAAQEPPLHRGHRLRHFRLPAHPLRQDRRFLLPGLRGQDRKIQHRRDDPRAAGAPRRPAAGLLLLPGRYRLPDQPRLLLPGRRRRREPHRRQKQEQAHPGARRRTGEPAGKPQRGSSRPSTAPSP